ncbi:hypothetical protein [Pelagibius sp.]|uniref:hypothetical protein n=1 Tax=Pelagibius sp. TaxID=1931238 RepID=UPI003B50CED9
MQRRFLGACGCLLGFALPLVLAACAADPLPRLTYAERPCYRTLAEVDCHAAPLPGEENRRVAFYDPPVKVEQRKAWPLSLFQ